MDIQPVVVVACAAALVGVRWDKGGPMEPAHTLRHTHEHIDTNTRTHTKVPARAGELHKTKPTEQPERDMRAREKVSFGYQTLAQAPRPTPVDPWPAAPTWPDHEHGWQAWAVPTAAALATRTTSPRPRRHLHLYPHLDHQGHHRHPNRPRAWRRRHRPHTRGDQLRRRLDWDSLLLLRHLHHLHLRRRH